jgi:hypothetical protein
LAKHDFGILDQFEENKWYQEYEPEKYNCVSVDMDVMDEVFSMYLEEMRQIKAFACISTQPICGLEESGITLIPPYSLKSFCDVITKANRQIQSHQLILLIDKIQESIKNDKYLIHFGI